MRQEGESRKLISTSRVEEPDLFGCAFNTYKFCYGHNRAFTRWT